MSYPQGTILTARDSFTFKGRRRVAVKAGQRFWVTNSRVDQNISGIVVVDREGRGTISNGWNFAADDIARLFAAETKGN